MAVVAEGKTTRLETHVLVGVVVVVVAREQEGIHREVRGIVKGRASLRNERRVAQVHHGGKEGIGRGGELGRAVGRRGEVGGRRSGGSRARSLPGRDVGGRIPGENGPPRS